MLNVFKLKCLDFFTFGNRYKICVDVYLYLVSLLKNRKYGKDLFRTFDLYN